MRMHICIVVALSLSCYYLLRLLNTLIRWQAIVHISLSCWVRISRWRLRSGHGGVIRPVTWLWLGLTHDPSCHRISVHAACRSAILCGMAYLLFMRYCLFNTTLEEVTRYDTPYQTNYTCASNYRTRGLESQWSVVSHFMLTPLYDNTSLRVRQLVNSELATRAIA